MEVPREVLLVVSVLRKLGFRVFLIGARALAFYGIVRETGDWDLTIDRPFSVEVRDAVTRELRGLGFSVQWRRWGFYVDAGAVHAYINCMPLTLDEEFISRSRALGDVLIPSIEDLIILKLMSGEDKDVEDVKRLLKLPNLDLPYLLRRSRDAGVDKDLLRIARKIGLRIDG
ncbi:DUF6036 family nucleotidyltransferase [Vulcanisaeta distributa]|uniref:DUF6036 domain-containing protein n=1 Tax=Vulcanisaeta distributa (strain DSM 14429 / JCM 11212 / NBRC 100878 / IC-017) TaxID=572478 RepID=E1QRH6_VULDI|nr:DUF6036 family nucleotidyltransferase [Vulcanisaeta distributa]ADN51790.1 conserved hypothetical protein [Vulcanisaeta distributa DSM 14429]